jgi:hypothetical protein
VNSDEKKPIENTTTPLTLEMFRKYCDQVFKKREPYNGPRADLTKLWKAGIPFHMERDDLVLVSSEGYKRAKEIGAILDEETAPTSPPDSLASLDPAPTRQSSPPV